MLLADQTTAMTMQAAAIIAPVGLYFFILGLINSRPTPQVVSSRTDFFVLVFLIGPVFVLPILTITGLSLVLSGLVIVLMGILLWVLSGSADSWVIYNTSETLAHDIISQVLEDMGLAYKRVYGEYRLTSPNVTVQVSSFAILRNVSVKITGANRDVVHEFESRMVGYYSSVRARTSMMAVTLMLLSMAMLSAPMLMIAHHAPQIAQIISDFWR